MPFGPVAAAIVGVDRAVKAPVLVLRLNIAIVFVVKFVTYTELPSGDEVMYCGPVPPEPIVGVTRAVNSPVPGSRLNIEMLLEVLFII